VQVGMSQYRRDQQWCVHHQTAHLESSGLPAAFFSTRH